jgi:tRNA A-37 threonylcarbamoyl transferase component Bud32
MGGGGNIHDLIKLARLGRNGKGNDFMNAEKRLRVGYHVASGVAAMHSIDEKPSLVHNDLCHHQYILMDGVYKLNDFHLASLNLIDKETGSSCKEPKWSPSEKVRTCIHV